jgi:hypothetical protein
MRSSPFLQAAGATASSPEGMLAEVRVLIAPKLQHPYSESTPFNKRIAYRRYPIGFNEIPFSVFIHFIAQYMWTAYGFKTWTPNKFHKI